MKYIFTSIVILALGLLGLLNPLRSGFLKLFVPVQFGLTNSARNIAETLKFFTNVNTVRNENIKLLETISALEEENARLKSLYEENSLLRSQLDFIDITGKNYKTTMVEVMGNPNDASDVTYLINAGSRDGIRVGDTALIGKNVVGTIKRVDYSRAELELITSPNLSFTAYDVDSKDAAQGLVIGKHNSILSFERILPNAELKEGDLILTGGKEGIFPPNYVVGKIIEIHNDPSQPLKKASVKTLLDFSKLTKVFILSFE